MRIPTWALVGAAVLFVALVALNILTLNRMTDAYREAAQRPLTIASGESPNNAVEGEAVRLVTVEGTPLIQDAEAAMTPDANVDANQYAEFVVPDTAQGTDYVLSNDSTSWKIIVRMYSSGPPEVYPMEIAPLVPDEAPIPDTPVPGEGG
jgi:hypothetical protein